MDKENEQEQQLEQPQDEEYQKPDPVKNPRDIALAEIAKTAAKMHAIDAAETIPSIDDDGVVTAPASTPAVETPTEPAAEPAPEQDSNAGEVPAAEGGEGTPAAPDPTLEAIDPKKLYKTVIDGVEVEVPGSKIIDAGFRTFRKETAADYRLQVAQQLLEEAQRSRPQPNGETPAEGKKELTNAEIAHAIQFGTAEQSAEAVAALRSKGITSPDQIRQFSAEAARAAARDEVAFQDALNFAKSEYGDLLAHNHLRQLFFMEENRYRAPKERGGLSDRRPYKEVYKDIGETLRKEFNRPKPTAVSSATPPPAGTAAGRQTRKSATPAVPKTAASRLSAVSEQAKVKTNSEIIAGMAASRGKNRLTQPTRKET